MFAIGRRHLVLSLLSLTLRHNAVVEGELVLLKQTESYIPSTQNAEYNCVFENTFNEKNHPKGMPFSITGFHWTKPILTSHDITYNMWKEGELASPAVKLLAESGGTADIVNTLEARGDDVKVAFDKYLFAIDQTINYNSIKVNSFKRYMSAITKLAPSPDWFTGFHDFNCVSESTNNWFKEFVIAVYPYDAGTEEGDAYDPVNQPTNPQQPIRQFTVDTVPQTTKVFLNAAGTDLLPVATYHCTLFDIEEGGRGFTQSPIFAELTQAPQGPLPQIQLSSDDPNDKKGSKAGLIIGVIAGAIAAIAIGGVLFYFLVCRPKRRRNNGNDYNDSKYSTGEDYTSSEMKIKKENMRGEKKTEKESTNTNNNDDFV